MRDWIIDPQESDTWKTQLTIAIIFISSKDPNERRGNTLKEQQFTSYNVANEVVGELFDSVCSRYQGNLEKTIRETESVFDSVQLMYYKYYKVNFRRGGSYIDSPGLIKNAITNEENEDEKCFQYAVTLGLGYGEIEKHSERV